MPVKHELTIQNGLLLLVSENEEFLDNIFETLSFKDSSKAFVYGGRFDPKRIITVRFAKYVEGDLLCLKIPVGFLDFIKSVLSENDIIIDKRKPIPEVEIDQIEHL